MATVYLAHDPKHDRQVAVKVLRPELAAVLGADRFVQEIKTYASGGRTGGGIFSDLVGVRGALPGALAAAATSGFVSRRRTGFHPSFLPWWQRVGWTATVYVQYLNPVEEQHMLRVSVSFLAFVLLTAQLTPGAVAQTTAGAELVSRFGLREAPHPVRQRSGWSPPTRIVTIGGNALADAFRSVAPEAEIIGVAGPADVPSVIGDAEVYIGWCTPEILAAGTNLEWIQIPSAGIETCSGVPAVRERDILVTNTQRIYGPQIAEMVIAMALSFAKRLRNFSTNQLAHQWGIVTPQDVLDAGLFELEGRTVLVVGLGGLGTEVARRAHGLGMRIIATRNSRREGPEYVEYVGLAHEVTDLAKQADFVVNTTPLTNDTRGMFNAEFFAEMKPSAYFINVGRGQSVVTSDLVEALQSNTIAGAGLDVTDPEPLPPGHPLWDMSNVIITPHVSASSERVLARFVTLVQENLRRYVAGERMLSVVDVVRGY